MLRSLLAPLLVAALFVWGFLACHQNDVAATQTGSLQLHFDNVVGNSNLVLNTNTYQNAAGESFNVSKFNYFVSNIRLRRADGTDFIVPQDKSYFLIEEERPASQTLALTGIPVGTYTGIGFLIGVDSVRSLADISLRTGVLDPGTTDHDAMYWDWNTGYIFMKLEGTSAVAPAAQNRLFQYHIGGFGGGYDGKKTINNLRSVALPFGSDQLVIGSSLTPIIDFQTDALQVFNGPNKLSIAQNSSVMFATLSGGIADNYASMFSYKRVTAGSK